MIPPGSLVIVGGRVGIMQLSATGDGADGITGFTPFDTLVWEPVSHRMVEVLCTPLMFVGEGQDGRRYDRDEPDGINCGARMSTRATSEGTHSFTSGEPAMLSSRHGLGVVPLTPRGARGMDPVKGALALSTNGFLYCADGARWRPLQGPFLQHGPRGTWSPHFILLDRLAAAVQSVRYLPPVMPSGSRPEGYEQEDGYGPP